MGGLSDFVTVRPWADAKSIYDADNGPVDPSPWLTCRQCRRKAKGTVAPASFYRVAKLTNKWYEAIIPEPPKPEATRILPTPDFTRPMRHFPYLLRRGVIQSLSLPPLRRFQFRRLNLFLTHNYAVWHRLEIISSMIMVRYIDLFDQRRRATWGNNPTYRLNPNFISYPTRN